MTREQAIDAAVKRVVPPVVIREWEKLYISAMEQCGKDNWIECDISPWLADKIRAEFRKIMAAQ